MIIDNLLRAVYKFLKVSYGYNIKTTNYIIYGNYSNSTLHSPAKDLPGSTKFIYSLSLNSPV